MSVNTVRLRYQIQGSPQEALTTGTGPTIAAARAELAARAAIMVGTALEVSESIAGDPAGYTMGSGTFNDLTLVLGKTGQADKHVTIHNARLAFAIDNKGRIDPTDSTLIAFATAFYDGNGTNGYTLVSGKFATN